MTNEDIRCEHCGRELTEDRAVYLEFSQTDNRYWFQIPRAHESQGGFPFGKDCANKVAADAPL